MKKIIAIGIIGIFLLSCFTMTNAFGKNNIAATSGTLPVRLTIIDDGDNGTGSTIDNKVNVPAFTPGSNTVGTVNTFFTINGTDGGDDQGRRYYGDDTHEDWKNITVTGDILFPVTSATLAHQGNGVWKLTWIPTKAGGSLTITINWPGSNNGSDSETINIINGSIVTTNIPSFFYGETVDVTATVKNNAGTLQEYADVYLIWFSGPTRVNSTVPGSGATGKGEKGEYTYKISPSDLPSSAPDNLTIATKTPDVNHWGYANIKLLKKNNLMLNLSIRGGLCFGKISSTLKNVGDFPASNINMSLHVKYGILRRTKNDTQIVTLSTGEDTTMKIARLRGIGSIKVKLTVSSDEFETKELQRTGLIISRFIFLF